MGAVLPEMQRELTMSNFYAASVRGQGRRHVSRTTTTTTTNDFCTQAKEGERGQLSKQHGKAKQD